MTYNTTIGVDLAKSVFQVHGALLWRSPVPAETLPAAFAQIHGRTGSGSLDEPMWQLP